MMNRPILNIKDSYNMFVIDQHKGGSNIPTDGLVGEWLFNGNALDTSGNGFHGTLVNSPTWTTDRKGNTDSACNFVNASKQYIVVPNFSYIPSFTISLWVLATTYGVFGIITKDSLVAGHGDFSIALGSDGVSNLIVNSNGRRTIDPDVLPLNVWTHIIGVYADLELKMYVNGILKDAFAYTAVLQDLYADLYLGLFYSDLYTWEGKIDDIRIYNRGLTNDEIIQLYNE